MTLIITIITVTIIIVIRITIVVLIMIIIISDNYINDNKKNHVISFASVSLTLLKQSTILYLVIRIYITYYYVFPSR